MSPEDGEVLREAVREALGARLANYLSSAWQRGGLEEAASLDALEPAAVRALWEREELASIRGGIPPAMARSPRAARKIAVLAAAVSEFTFGRAGDMKRRPEPAGACPALASAGFAGPKRAPEDEDAPERSAGESSGTVVPESVRQHVG